MRKNKNNRYRMNDFTARKIGKVPNLQQRYRLKGEYLKRYLDLDQDNIKRLFFDIETSPMIVYSWRIGWKLSIPPQNIIENWKIICISYKWEHEDKVKNLVWDENQDDKQMLIDFIKIMNQSFKIPGL